MIVVVFQALLYAFPFLFACSHLNAKFPDITFVIITHGAVAVNVFSPNVSLCVI